MRRLKCEKETIILTNEDDGFYDVYTFNQSLQKRLRTFAEKYPDDCWLKGSSEDGSDQKRTVVIEFKTTLFQG